MTIAGQNWCPVTVNLRHLRAVAMASGVPQRATLEFVHVGLSAKYSLTTALARLRERGDPDESGWVRDSLILYEEK